VKRLEELGIGRPSTYAATLQVLKDRAYVRAEKNRFFAEETGRLLTSFLERFFPRYVGYDFTAGMEEELDDVSGGAREWKGVLEAFWRDFKPKSDEVMEKKPSEVTEALDEFLGDYLFPPKEDGSDPRECPACHAGVLRCAGAVWRLHRLLELSRMQVHPQIRPAGRFGRAGRGRRDRHRSGHRPADHPPQWPFRPLHPVGDGDEKKRASIPKDIGELTLDWASSCSACRARSASIPKAASRSPPVSGAMAPIWRITANTPA
jgi:DNA topoisomerase-1